MKRFDSRLKWTLFWFPLEVLQTPSVQKKVQDCQNLNYCENYCNSFLALMCSWENCFLFLSLWFRRGKYGPTWQHSFSLSSNPRRPNCASKPYILTSQVSRTFIFTLVIVLRCCIVLLYFMYLCTCPLVSAQGVNLVCLSQSWVRRSGLKFSSTTTWWTWETSLSAIKAPTRSDWLHWKSRGFFFFQLGLLVSWCVQLWERKTFREF